MLSEELEDSGLAKTRTFIDSGVLIAAAVGKQDLSERAQIILDDPDRLLITSDFIRLEVLPKARFHKNEAEAQFYEEFFRAADQTVAASKELVDEAQHEAETAGLGAFDALHVAAALQASSDELVTTEKTAGTIFWTKSITVRTIRPPGTGR